MTRGVMPIQSESPCYMTYQVKIIHQLPNNEAINKYKLIPFHFLQ